MRFLLLPLLLVAAAPVAAEVELSFYGGWQGAPDGGVTISGAGTADREVDLGSEAGLGFGARATLWTESDIGVALDYSRLGEAGAEGDASGDGASVGAADVLTIGGLYRWEDAFGGVTPYVGAGVGLAQAEITVEDGASSEVGASGPAASFVAGASVPLSESLSVFGEYEGTYVDIEGETEDGRSVGAEGLSSSINLGVSFSF